MKSLSYITAMEQLGIDQEVMMWSENWTELKESDSLTTDFICYWTDYLEFPEHIKELLKEGLSLFKDVPAAYNLLSLCRILLFKNEKLIKCEELSKWPLPSFKIHPYAELFYVYVLLSELPELEKKNRQRNIPVEVFRETISDLTLWMDKHYELTGHHGLSEFSWLYLHFTGRIFRLGRLQFELSNFNNHFSVLRHNKSTRVLMITGEENNSDSEGRLISTNNKKLAGINSGVYKGKSISPKGKVLNGSVNLDTNVWRTVLAEDDPVLNIHIPSGEPMAHAACGESFKRAVAFFNNHFPDFKFKAFLCYSWLLDPQLLEYLPAESNISAFMNEMYLFPLPDSESSDIIKNVLAEDCINPLQFHPKTTLQKIVINHLRQGRSWHIGGAFLLKEDLDWGMQCYRRKEKK